MICIAVCIAAHAVLANAVVGAAPSPVQPAFGNTIVSTYPDGRKARLWLRPDGVYAIKGRTGVRSSGHWSVRGDKLCLRQSRPFPVLFNFCSPIPTGLSGGSWTAKVFTGETVRMEVVRGDDQFEAPR